MKVLKDGTVEYEIINKSKYLKKLEDKTDKEIFDRYFVKDANITKENKNDIFYKDYKDGINEDEYYDTFCKINGINNNHIFASVRDKVVSTAQSFGYKINTKNLIKDIDTILNEDTFKYEMLDVASDNIKLSKFIEELAYKISKEVMLQKGLRNNLLKNHEDTI